MRSLVGHLFHVHHEQPRNIRAGLAEKRVHRAIEIEMRSARLNKLALITEAKLIYAPRLCFREPSAPMRKPGLRQAACCSLRIFLRDLITYVPVLAAERLRAVAALPLR